MKESVNKEEFGVMSLERSGKRIRFPGYDDPIEGTDSFISFGTLLSRH